MIKHSFFVIFLILIIPFSVFSQTTNNSSQKNRAKASISIPSPSASIVPKITVFPNPVKDVLKFENPTQTKIKEIMIINHVGRFISQTEVNSKSPEIDVKELERGIYRLIVITKNGLKLSQSFVKE